MTSATLKMGIVDLFKETQSYKAQLKIITDMGCIPLSASGTREAPARGTLFLVFVALLNFEVCVAF